MTAANRIKTVLRNYPRIIKIIHRLGLKSQSDWLFRKDVLAWITDPRYKKQFPFLWRLFADYCQFWITRIDRQRIVGANILLRIVTRIQRMFAPKNSVFINFPKIGAFLDIEDPRFLAVGNEIISGDIEGILSSNTHKGDTFIDIGANHGACSLIASKLVGPAGLIVAIEPQPQLAANLKRSLDLNPQCNFQVYQMAVGDYNGTIDLIIPHSYSGTAGVYIEHSGLDRYRKLRVPIKRFDESIDWKKFPGSVFIKLDIEGAEYAFLLGATEMIDSLRPTLMMEINPYTLRAAETEKKDLVDLLRSLGYEHYRDLKDMDSWQVIDGINTTRFQNILLSVHESALSH